MKIIVTGGRHYNDRDKVFKELHSLSPTLIVQGGATGADALARRYAKAAKIECITYQADWTLGKRAGPLRNQKMLFEHRDGLLISFPGNNGTKDCTTRAKALNMKVRAIT